MEAVRLPRPGRTHARGQVAVVCGLVALAGAAWVGTRAARGPGMAGMGMPDTVGPLAFFVIAWALMMAAMMFPSISPLVLTYRRLVSARRKSDLNAPTGATAFLLAGYLVVWTATGLIGYLSLEGARALAPPALAWERGGPYLASAVILAAAAYQFTPLKDVCLTRCRGPLSFFLEHWREGRAGAAWMGALHGAYCVGCCFALMGTLFALGVMSVLWMGLVAALIAAEKLLPWRDLSTAAVAAILLVLGVWVALTPESLPGLDPSGAVMPMRDG